MKTSQKSISFILGVTTIAGVMHVITLPKNCKGIKVTDIFKQIQDEGYTPICPNGLKVVSETTELVKELLTGPEKAEYVLSMKDPAELGQVRFAYWTKNNSSPIRLIDQDENLVKNYKLEPGCTIAILSGEKQEVA